VLAVLPLPGGLADAAMIKKTAFRQAIAQFPVETGGAFSC
jgi:hypothetical protein